MQWSLLRIASWTLLSSCTTLPPPVVNSANPTLRDLQDLGAKLELSPFGVYLQGYYIHYSVWQYSDVLMLLMHSIHLYICVCTHICSVLIWVQLQPMCSLLVWTMSLSPWGVLTFLGFICICSTQSWLYSDVLYSYEPEPSGALLSLWPFWGLFASVAHSPVLLWAWAHGGSESLTFLGFICICGAQSWLWGS